MPRRRRRLLPHLVRTITLAHWAEHWVRTVLTVVGVALGVATIVAQADISASVLASFGQMVTTVAGSSELEVANPAGPIDEALVTTVAETPGVAAAAGMLEAFVTLADHSDETLYVIGVDFLGTPLWQAQIPRDQLTLPDDLDFVAHLDSVMITRGLATRYGLGFDGTLRVIAPAGAKTLRVRAMMDDVPIARLFDGTVAVMDLPAAQALLGYDRRVDRIAVELADGATAAEVEGRLRERVGPGIEIAAPEARGRQAEKLLQSLRSMLATSGALAVMVGMLLVFQAVSVSVQQRRREFALLTSVGVTQRTQRLLCLAEVLVLAGIGAPLGLVGGRLLGELATGVVTAATGEIWMHIGGHAQVHSVPGALVAVGAGVAVALGAAALALRATFAAPTVEALRPVEVALEPSPRPARALGLAAAVCVSGYAVYFIPPRHPTLIEGGITYATLSGVLTAALIAPTLVMLAGAPLRALFGRSRSLALRLAVVNLPRAPRRAGMTVASIAAGVMLVALLMGLVASFERAWLGWIEDHFGADLFVGSGSRVRLISGPPMGPDVRAAIAGIDGVESVEPFRLLAVRMGETPVWIQALSLDDRLAHGGLAMVSGDFAAAVPALRSGTGVLVSENLAFLEGLRPGDMLPVPTPAGPRAMQVEGVFVDYLGSLDQGAIAVSTEQMAALWDDRSANLYRLWLRRGVDASAVRTTVLKRLGTGYYAITSRQFLEAVRAVLDTLFAATWALVAVAGIVSVIGVMNVQLATVLDRAAEIGMLGTIGVTRRDVVWSVLLECGALGLLGGMLGFVLGGLLSAQFVTISLRRVTGWRIAHELPVGPLLGVVLAAGLVSAVAGWVPARAAARSEEPQRSVD